MLLLLVLYTLQGIPMGLGASIPFILQERKALYNPTLSYSLADLASMYAADRLSRTSNLRPGLVAVQPQAAVGPTW